ncbi:MAG: toprim domain-containing protein [Steroidobacteraceae bacterium]
MVVVEGYMDVIALAAAGIGDAVAPLGTALTEQQIEMLWRLWKCRSCASTAMRRGSARPCGR